MGKMKRRQWLYSGKPESLQEKMVVENVQPDLRSCEGQITDSDERFNRLGEESLEEDPEVSSSHGYED